MDTQKFRDSHSVPEETMSGNYSEARAIMKFLHEVERLKRLARSGWQLKKIPDPESVADHSHRLTIMACFAERPLDARRIMQMAAVHDLGEIVAGDYTPHDKIPKEEKHGKEKLLFQWLQSILPNHPVAKMIMDLWQEYEDRTTPEALWLYDADKLESVIQSVEYTLRGYPNLEEFLGLVPKFKSPQLIAWGKVLLEELQQDHRQQIPVIFITGLPSIDKMTPSKRLSKEFDALYLSLHDILLQKSVNSADPHSEFAALYLQKGLDTSPIGFMIDLLKEKIDEGLKQGKSCVILDGFPRSLQQLRGFEEKIQKRNLTLLLNHSGDVSGQENVSEYAIRALRDLENQPDQLFKKIDCDDSEENVYAVLKEAAEAFIKRAGNK